MIFSKGKTMIERDRNTGSNAPQFPYLPSGKERDEESGLSYFGSRYYDSELSIWLSVDPMASKFPSLTPFCYAANNPLTLIDPDGNKIRFAKGVSAEFKNAFKTAIQHLNAHKVGGTASALEKSKVVYTITEGASGYQSSFDSKNQTITWCITDGIFTDKNNILSPATVLNHELGHALNYDKAVTGTEADRKDYNKNNTIDNSNPYSSKEEENVIKGIEQTTAKALGEIEFGETTRDNHKGFPIKTKGVTSNKPLGGVEVKEPKVVTE